MDSWTIIFFFAALIVSAVFLTDTVHSDNTHNRHVHTLEKIKEDWTYSVNRGDEWLHLARIAINAANSNLYNYYADNYEENEQYILINKKRYETYLKTYLKEI